MNRPLLNEDSGDWMFPLVFVILALCLLVLTIGLTIGAVTSSAAAATCSNSYPADGHPGPYWMSSGGGTLHSNTVKISCPGPATPWSIITRVQYKTGGLWINACPNSACVWSDQGAGSAQESFATAPAPCVHGPLYRTHTVNVFTGGVINKPGGGSGVVLNC